MAILPSKAKAAAQRTGAEILKSSANAGSGKPLAPSVGHRTLSAFVPAMTLNEFLIAPRAEIARVAPSAMVYAASGTRRQAALTGIDSHSDAYVRWSHIQALEVMQMIFEHGVRHVFTLLAGPGQFQEVGAYRANLLDWIEWGVASDEALAEFRRRGWRARLLCDEGIPQLDRARQRLSTLNGSFTVWFQVVPDSEAPWRWLLDAAQRSGARTRSELVQALYGEAVPLVNLYLAFGKPIIAPELLPPLLADTVQCYWSQRPGYSLTEDELRRVLFDYAYLRPTWQADKTGRAEEALTCAEIWQNGSILGLGQRLGPFWYPQPFDAPKSDDDELWSAGRLNPDWERAPCLSVP